MIIPIFHEFLCYFNELIKGLKVKVLKESIRMNEMYYLIIILILVYISQKWAFLCLCS